MSTTHNTTVIMAYSFTVTVASGGYHVYKNTSWTNARVGEKVTVEMETKKFSLEVDPYACAIKFKNCFFDSLITVGHIPHEMSRQFTSLSKLKTVRLLDITSL